MAAAPSRLGFPKVRLPRVVRTRRRSRDSPVSCLIRTSLASEEEPAFVGHEIHHLEHPLQEK